MSHERTFPILSERVRIPWHVIEPHGGQAKRNHYQTLERLAERGGLSWSEMAAVLEDREWRKMDAAEARRIVEDHVSRVCGPLAEIAALRAENTKLRKAIDDALGRHQVTHIHAALWEARDG